MKSSLRFPGVALAFVLVSAVSLRATCGGGGGGGSGGFDSSDSVGQSYQVPWKFFRPGQAAPTEGLVLYWFPASTTELQRSGLRTSRSLALYSASCPLGGGYALAAFVADFATSPVARKLDPATKAPAALLTDAAGHVLGQVSSHNGTLRAADVEKMVRDEMGRLDDALAAQLNDARAKAKAGDKAGAIQAFQAVWSERCLFPKRAKDAAKELKKLGVTTADDTIDSRSALDAVFTGPVADQVVDAMQRGLQAELAGDYETALRLYAEAHRLDPIDPTPARYLGEVYRHYTGQWDKARAVFTTLLAGPADPLSRAVAMQGLGKMTIHEGQFAKGLGLIEDSTKEFPLALAYRNLAVFWNSECNPVKAAAYVEQALALDPKDPYNIVFAAVFLAQNGRKDEALRIAKENEALLPASYNLAAIYAQAGQPDRAIEYLQRHFYTYERYQAVRGEEMMEARVDEMFVSLRTDPRFIQLTAMADGRLPVKWMAH